MIDVQGKQKVQLAYQTGLAENDRERELQSRIHATSGSACQQVGLHLITKVCEAVAPLHASLEETIEILNTLAKAMQSMQPRDEIEGHLISQLVVLHEQCMTWLGKANRAENIDFANVYLNGASKLLVRHHETLAAFLKYRRGDEQRVHVEHVHIHNGGQAIVGNIKVGEGQSKKMRRVPMQRCSAKSKRTGHQCKNYAIKHWGVCRMHGAKGGPKTADGLLQCRQASVKHGFYTAQVLRERKQTLKLLKLKV